jgi:phosphodiesterase/alkaline phosphatase D-like protein
MAARVLIIATFLKQDSQHDKASIMIAGRFGTAIFECSGSATIFVSSALACLRCSRWRSGYIYIYIHIYIHIYTHLYMICIYVYIYIYIYIDVLYIAFSRGTALPIDIALILSR